MDLSLRTYCGSVLAMSVCHMLAVSRSSYLLAWAPRVFGMQRCLRKDLGLVFQGRINDTYKIYKCR